MRAWLWLLCASCSLGEPIVQIEPAQVDLVVGLDMPTTVPVKATLDGRDVTADVTWTLDGAQLGSVDTNTLVLDARTGGTARLVATIDDAKGEATVHVKLTSSRQIDGPDQAPTWFREGMEVAGGGALDPVDRSVLPPNLARLDVDFTTTDSDDVQEIAVTSADLDFRVQTLGTPGPRASSLTVAEWEAIVRTSRGRGIEIAARSTSSADPTTIRAQRSRVAIADLAFPSEILFTGRPGAEAPQVWSYMLANGSTQRWADSGAANGCLGCHLALSRDGTRIAAGGFDGTNGGGLIVDASSRYFAVPPNPAIGSWTAAAFDPSGALLTTGNGVMELRDGGTGMVVATLDTGDAINRPAQPAISRDGQTVAYLAGPIDDFSKQPFHEEVRVATWSAANASLGASSVLVPHEDNVQYKMPDFSFDDRWLSYTRARTNFARDGIIMVRPADGSGAAIALTNNGDFARFATPFVVAASGGEPEPMAWIVFKSYRAIGGRTYEHQGKLWVMAFYPERGAASQPIPLPGQDPTVAVLHAPLVR